MEVPIMSRISGFEADISRLQAPSLFSKLLRFSGSDEAASLHVLGTWGPLIVALVAALGSLVRTVKLLLLLLRVLKADAFTQIKDSSDVVVDDVVEDDGDVSSCCCSSFENEAVSHEDDGMERLEMDFCVAGTSRRRLFDQFSRSVVKLWDSSFTSSIVAFDTFAGGKARTYKAGLPAVVVSAGDGCRAAGEVWDSQAGRGEEAAVAEWAVPDSAVVGVGLGSWEVVLVGGAGGGAGGQRLTVRDLRMAGLPLALAAEMV